MAQAFASAAPSAVVSTAGSGVVVQDLLKTPNSYCTSYSSEGLVRDVATSLFRELADRSGSLPPADVQRALSDLVASMAAMAEGTASPAFFLSSLDPGVGKTTALIHFLQALLRLPQHEEVSALVCVPRLEEIKRLVEELGLSLADVAVCTSDEVTNSLSPTPQDQARVLITTHSMVRSRCKSGSFRNADVFHFLGRPRDVRIWDEEMLPGEVVSLTTDQLAALRDPLRVLHPSLVDLIEELEHTLKVSFDLGGYDWPEVEAVTGVSWPRAQKGLSKPLASYLEALYSLSGRRVLLRKSQPGTPVITALNTRDAIPSDLAPAVVLDASGRVRATYDLWEQNLRTLIRLSSATRVYGNLKIHVWDRGAGKTAWVNCGNTLASEVARIIDQKPDEDWLVIHHKGGDQGGIPNRIRGLLRSSPERVTFLHWGIHQGTNAYRHIRNVVITGLNTYRETDYEMQARYYGCVADTEDVPKALADQMRAGEHMHHVLQALCRSAVRSGHGAACGSCEAYIIAPKQSGLRRSLPSVFPGCKVSVWTPSTPKPRGKVRLALAYISTFFGDHPNGVLPFVELRGLLGYEASNFRRRIREHPTFKAELTKMGVEEVASGRRSHKTAFALNWAGTAKAEAAAEGRAI